MKILIVGAAIAAALSLGACSSLPGLGGNGLASLNDTLLKIATDPNCGHDDELNVVLGAVPSGTINIKRQCAVRAPSAVAPAAPAAAAPAAK